MIHRVRVPFTAAVLFAAMIAARPAFAGPPLLCHPFDIGSAASLPWNGSNWLDGKPDYRLESLIADTEALLGPSTPVIVRMETLRRASLYAGRDRRIAAALLKAMTERAQTAPAGRPGALALLDAAYVTEALRQITTLGVAAGYTPDVAGIRDVVRGADGRSLMHASLAAAPDDPSLEFAAALVAAGTDSAAYRQHAERARAGAASDALLAKNLSHLS